MTKKFLALNLLKLTAWKEEECSTFLKETIQISNRCIDIVTVKLNIINRKPSKYIQ